MSNKLATLFLLMAVLAPTQPAGAVPYVYANTVLGVSDLKRCVDNAKRVATKNEFTEDIRVVDDRDAYADHASKPMTLTISCSTRLGSAAIAVAGMNNDDTFKAFKQVYDDF